ncbi:MAG: hypothetical protein AB7N24_12120 [Dehalococcoidia bacterium]
MDDSEVIHFDILRTDRVSDSVFDEVRRLFGENYRDANIAYLEGSLGKLRFLSIARSASGVAAGFALAEARVVDLPRLPNSNVHLHGLACVGADFRRHGLFGKLERAALSGNSLPPAERLLGCGRCAHPASFRNFFKNPAAVPHRSHPPTEWQREVGIAIAEAYGSPSFDPETFVVGGSGVPIGWPVIEIEASPEEWKMFEPVDRSKGDSLLGIAWSPEPPPGWLD